VGLLTAREFTRQRLGPDSPPYRNLSNDPELFLRKAGIVNSCHARATAMYSRARDDGGVWAAKPRLFAELQQECAAITPDPASFKKFVGAANNAGLAFDYTYTKYYPLFYELHAAQGRNLQATVGAIRRLRSEKIRSEDALLGEVQQWIGQTKAP